MGSVGPKYSLKLLLFTLFVRSCVGDGEGGGGGSPCYDLDADGRDDLNKPQVRRLLLTNNREHSLSVENNAKV